MVYSFALIKHANIRYREYVIRLGMYELLSILRSFSIDCEVQPEEMGGSDFLTFECRPLTDNELSCLSGHSTICFMAEKTGSLLKPLQIRSSGYLKEDLPEVLKYKGKTSTAFTRMMINICRSLLKDGKHGKVLTLLDPMCGKGTSCFCALVSGMNAIGLDIDTRDIRETSDYFARYLKMHLLKHTVKKRSETAGRTSVPVTEFVFADTKEHYQSGDTRSLLLANGDTCLSPYIARKRPAHILVADLPYGIQHAPQSGTKPEPFSRLLERALPEWKKALVPGGAVAISFNTLTLPADTVVSLLEKSGFIPLRDEWYSGFRHEVEQAVVRDVVFARKSP
jgi:SAM-dependent methyltransferase